MGEEWEVRFKILTCAEAGGEILEFQTRSLLVTAVLTENTKQSLTTYAFLTLLKLCALGVLCEKPVCEKVLDETQKCWGQLASFWARARSS